MKFLRLGRTFGQTDELAAALKFIERGDRLISVVGAAGAGASRLATTIAADLPAMTVEWRDAADLGAGGVRPGETTQLLVIDNVSVPSESFTRSVVECLDRQRLQIVITARRRLNLRGERVVWMHPLGLPGLADTMVRHLIGIDSVEMFCDRASEVADGFEITGDNAADIADICRLLQGNPLAIELTARRCASLAPSEILEQLGQSLSLVSAGPIDLPERQRDYAEALTQWLVSQSEAEQRLVAGLAYFEGPAEPGALAAVLGTTADVMLGATLVEGSLAYFDRTSGERRIAISLPMRHIARTQPTFGQFPEALAHHSTWFLARATVLGSQVGTESSLAAMAQLEVELPDVLAASDRASVVDAAAALSVLSTYLRMSARQDVGLRRATALLGRSSDDETSCRLLILVGELSASIGDDARSTDALVRAWALPQLAAPLRAQAGIALLFAHIRSDAFDEFNRLLPLVEPYLDDAEPSLLIRWNEALGCEALARADNETARRLLAKSAEQYESSGDLLRAANSLTELSYAHAACGAFVPAEQSARRSIRIAESIGAGGSAAARSLSDLAMVYLARRKAADALRVARKGVNAAERQNISFEIGRALRIEALALAEDGQQNEARNAFATSAQLIVASGSTSELANLMVCLIMTAGGPFGDARFRLRVGASAAEMAPDAARMHGPFWVDRLERALADCRAELGDAAARDAETEGAAADLDLIGAWVAEALRSQETTAGVSLEPLSGREIEVLRLMARGLSDRQIADRLTIGIRTVNTHVSRVLRKVGVSRRSEAAAWAHFHGFG